jgi:hypothetical protein
MSTVQPEGEELRRAVKWISEQRQEGASDLRKLIEEACITFNLSPRDAETLSRRLLASNG